MVVEVVPGLAAGLHDVVVSCEDGIGQPVVAQELPDVFDGVQLGTFWRQGEEGDIVWHAQRRGGMPARLIEDQHGLRATGDMARDFGQMGGHRFGVAMWHDQASRHASRRADRAKDIGRDGP